MSIPILTYRCKRCDYSQAAGFSGSHIYVYQNGNYIPVISRTGWCLDCNEVREIEDLSIHPRLEHFKSLQQTIRSVQNKKRLIFSSWTYDARTWSDDPEWRERITAETFDTWADQLEQAIKSIEFLHTRQSPPRCLICGGTRVDAGNPTDPNSKTETHSHHVLLHPGCGGELELHAEGDIFIKGSRPVRGYSTEGGFISQYKDGQLIDDK
ncbi:MAG: hypothetical protein KZQ91_01235 [Candidatus Thiodiazotropha sp. (ex Lucinoma borealis)]|nr:hypothetical protein [Candidatus Thiodiazotropha sp. (ex Lucinoma borealis)]